MSSRMVDVKAPGAILEADAETCDGAWFRLSSSEYRYGQVDGASGWALIDGSSFGFGVLFEPVGEVLATPSAAVSKKEGVQMLPAVPPTLPVLSGLPVRSAPPEATVAQAPAARTARAGRGRAAAEPTASSLSVAAALELAGLSVEAYEARLASAGIAGVYGAEEAQGVADDIKRASMPMGHRLKLAGVYIALGKTHS